MMQRIVYGYLKVCKKQKIVDRGEPEGIESGKRRGWASGPVACHSHALSGMVEQYEERLPGILT
jgi:hypothetical protein